MLIALQIKFQRPRKRQERNPTPLHLRQPRRSLRPRLIDTEDLDTMATTRDMEIPIPRASHERRLRVERVIPASHHKLEPAFGVDGDVYTPCTPGVEVLLRKQLVWRFVPDATAIGTHLDALGPVPARSSGESPALHVDGAVMDDHAFIEGMHDC